MDASITMTVDGREHTLTVDTRTTLLDVVRDHLNNWSPKKGCDHGQCGACTMLVDGRRVTTCLSLAVAQDGRDVVTAAGLADGDQLHPVQQAFIDQDAFQCGYCTPGQVCSAVGMLDEAGGADLSDDEIRERMSGNLCRCGAYVNIVAAVRQAADGAPDGRRS
ncbi:(2Fe-2S)-binding protein [Spelaeicoccus albus]|uniref:Xanthine dehydrogenase YagT iron-sulfur-binding subunit n=1 Tax=Spelaeicoccus albus TaxID=1280376 RepID=A0A7Z0ACL2_9MICO|nr:(2Fe-2S)-binding protein [Spelaeicoccus albus]NYI66771.1 xanthine dehydrogenase YagT iron-sulfur-binding subunit [Spelaeicoccus albus]